MCMIPSPCVLFRKIKRKRKELKKVKQTLAYVHLFLLSPFFQILKKKKINKKEKRKEGKEKGKKKEKKEKRKKRKDKTFLAEIKACNETSTDTPKLQNPCKSGGETFTKA